jgi:predicted nucleic acid-binding protein
LIYLDSSAVVKLARREAKTNALRAWIAANPQPLTASALTRTEAARALLRTDPTALSVLRSVLPVLHQVPVSDAILDRDAQLPEPTLRTLDAIRLATAEEFDKALTWFVAYDNRLAAAARSRTLPVIAPA